MSTSSLLSDVHRRYNPLRKSWVLCSPHRARRPWQGQEETILTGPKPEYDAACYLCPGNTRSNGTVNPKYTSTFIFTNDFAAVNEDGVDSPEQSVADEDNLFVATRVNGTAVVVCFSPNHGQTIAEMSSDQILGIISAWREVYAMAKADPVAKYCQIFENKGSAMGCSNPHPHGQAWLTSVVPDEPQIEHDALAEYHAKHGTHMLEDYVKKELADGSRIVDQNDTFVVLVPFWATWPFETLLVSKKRIDSIEDLTKSQQRDLADMLQSLTVRYDNLFKTSFPYSMGIHQAFTRYASDEVNGVEHLLFHFYPPLLRSATVRKFLVGFELLGMPQRDITPESAAASIRNQSTVHYTKTLA